MAQRNTPEALAGIDKLIAEARARLANNPDYITVNALEKARAEIVGVKGAAPVVAETLTLDWDRRIEGIAANVFGKKVSQLAGAAMALEEVGHPLAADKLMDKAVEHGAVVGGTKPVISFGSSLSKSPKFKSVRWNGEYAWWFSDRPLPSSVARLRPTREAAE